MPKGMAIEMELVEIDTKEKKDDCSITYKLAQKVGKDEKPDFKTCMTESVAKDWGLSMVGDVISLTIGKVEKQAVLDVNE